MNQNHPVRPALSPKQRQQYDRDGLLVLPRFLDDDTVAGLSQAADQVVIQLAPVQPGMKGAQVDPTADGYRLRLVEPVLRYSDTFVHLAEDRRIVGLFESLFGEPPILFEDKLNYKYPRGGSAFPMHQDYSYWQEYSPRLTSAMIYIDEATEENGCLQAVPGWYRKGLLPKEGFEVNFGTDHHVSESVLDPALAVRVPGAPGTAILFSCLTPHTSAPNLSDRPRRAIILTYHPASDGDSYQERYGMARPTTRPAPHAPRGAGESYGSR